MLRYIIKACMPLIGFCLNALFPVPKTTIDGGQFLVVTSSSDSVLEWHSQDDDSDNRSGQSHSDATESVERAGKTDMQQNGTAERFTASCQRELDAWQAGLVPSDRYWAPWNDGPAPWCSEFVGWNLQNIGLVAGETMPADPSYAAAYYSFYADRSDLAEVHENDGSYVPRAGDIVLFSEFSHTEMVEQVDEDGLGWSGISGGSSVDRVRRSLSDGSCQWFITLL